MSTATDKKCIRCGKVQPAQQFYSKSDYCHKCRKPNPKGATYRYQRKLSQDAERRKAAKLAGEVRIKYACICSRNPDNCKAAEHTV